jgi:hypothetical protein
MFRCVWLATWAVVITVVFAYFDENMDLRPLSDSMKGLDFRIVTEATIEYRITTNKPLRA